jgi:hypothetical protein
MLERECYNVLDTLKRHCEGITREALTDDHLDPASIIPWVPVVLAKEFLLEGWKVEQC